MPFKIGEHADLALPALAVDLRRAARFLEIDEAEELHQLGLR